MKNLFIYILLFSSFLFHACKSDSESIEETAEENSATSSIEKTDEEAVIETKSHYFKKKK